MKTLKLITSLALFISISTLFNSCKENETNLTDPLIGTWHITECTSDVLPPANDEIRNRLIRNRVFPNYDFYDITLTFNEEKKYIFTGLPFSLGSDYENEHELLYLNTNIIFPAISYIPLYLHLMDLL